VPTCKHSRESKPVTILGFTSDHFWVRASEDRAQIGLSDYGQSQAGEIIALDLSGVGEQIEKGEPFGEMESVRTVQELIAPVSGTVIATNADIEESPYLANEDPYHDGWLIEVELSNVEELDDLLDAAEYEEFVAAEDES
jgi:glycine cleavage system H protein